MRARALLFYQSAPFTCLLPTLVCPPPQKKSYDSEAFNVEQVPPEEIQKARDEIVSHQKSVQASIKSQQGIKLADMEFIANSFIPQYFAAGEESLHIVGCKVQGRGHTLMGSMAAIGWRSKKWWEANHPAALSAYIETLDSAHPLHRGSKAEESAPPEVVELHEATNKRAREVDSDSTPETPRASKLHKTALIKAQTILQEYDSKSDTPWHEHRNQQVQVLRWLGFPFDKDVDAMLQTCVGQVWLQQQICNCDSN